jgi:hypothetical protein
MCSVELTRDTERASGIANSSRHEMVKIWESGGGQLGYGSLICQNLEVAHDASMALTPNEF